MRYVLELCSDPYNLYSNLRCDTEQNFHCITISTMKWNFIVEICQILFEIFENVRLLILIERNRKIVKLNAAVVYMDLCL